MEMKIGELATQAGCGVETVRYYEREGLLPEPGRSAGNYRLYDDKHLARLRFIRRCRSLDMSHEEIRELLALQAAPTATCDGVNACVDAHIQHVQDRMDELRALLSELQALRQRCTQTDSVATCGILDALNTPTAFPKSQAEPSFTYEGHGTDRTHRRRQ